MDFGSLFSYRGMFFESKIDSKKTNKNETGNQPEERSDQVSQGSGNERPECRAAAVSEDQGAVYGGRVDPSRKGTAERY